MSGFQLDQRLAGDCIVIGDFPLSRMLLMNDSRYPWIILVPRVPGAEEVFQLTDSDQHQLLKESSYVAEKLKDVFSADKMNVAALGNIVRQLHMHIVVRRSGDDAWPGPVWGQGERVPYSAEQAAQVQQRLATVFTTWLKPVDEEFSGVES
ncbi:HIT domain-containing protein [Parendozoicomonas haliclonae]|uniref:HIT domain protein n=1 Tax=Parendozoicomonas haliclonae TaxID=1960125 RepID=A0A1X7APE5_9GAMM|nr:HIT domain-containing protein [Parendozoicomonas haliclonae]SMA49978.1 HIT domain protein [Parendozoicomonas haliclonae]